MRRGRRGGRERGKEEEERKERRTFVTVPFTAKTGKPLNQSLFPQLPVSQIAEMLCYRYSPICL